MIFRFNLIVGSIKLVQLIIFIKPNFQNLTFSTVPATTKATTTVATVTPPANCPGFPYNKLSTQTAAETQALILLLCPTTKGMFLEIGICEFVSSSKFERSM